MSGRDVYRANARSVDGESTEQTHPDTLTCEVHVLREISALVRPGDGENLADAVRRLVRERDEARRGRNDALQVLGQAREALPSDMRGGWLVDAVRRLVRERDEARAAMGGQEQEHHTRLAEERESIRILQRKVDETREALATMTRQRDEATALASRLRCDLDRATDREDGLTAERARCVASLRHDAEHLAWPLGTSPNEVLRVAADRLERGEHAGTPVPEPLPRATDEELCALAHRAMELRQGVTGAALAVAARVRREQAEADETLAAVRAEVTRARKKFPANRHMLAALVEEVGELSQALLEEQGADRVRAEAIQVACVAVRIIEEGDADYVPATLARQLGEVTR